MKKIKITLVILVLMLFIPFNVKADEVTETPVFGYKTIWDIESVYYYLEGDSSNYSSVIANAANNWVYTGYGYNKLWPNTRIYDISGTAIDFYTYTENSNVLAYTYAFARTNGTTGDAYHVWQWESDWLFSEIHINQTTFDQLSTYDKQGTIAHEFGHAWGLAHNQDNQHSIMCQLGAGRLVNTVQQVDQNAFNSIY